MTEYRPPHLSRCRRSDVEADFVAAWNTTEALFGSLKNEAAYLAVPEHGLRYPLIFYYGHAAVFYINKLLAAGLISEPVNREFEDYFAIGVDEQSWDDMTKSSRPWPSLELLRHYREKVREVVLGVIREHPLLAEGHAPINEENPMWALFMAIEHERIHVETSSVLIRELPLEHVKVPAGMPEIHGSARLSSASAPVAGRDYPASDWVKVPAGMVRIGKPPVWPAYGWDCEYGEKTANVSAFAASKFLASNGELSEFVASGGYESAKYWSDEGWKWKEFRKAGAPAFWRKLDQGWALRTCFEEIPMPWSWPAIVNFHEAKAYCAWRSERDGCTYRLMGEAEHHRLRGLVDERPVSHASWFGEAQTKASPLYANANFNLRVGSETPVDRFSREPGVKACDVFGNVWQWCEDKFEPLTGFKAHALYADYSTPSFDGRHQLVLGGSFMSSGEMTTPWTRSNFRPHFYQHAGFRLVKA